MRNPKAADSLKGIANWRLQEERVHETVEDTERALQWLLKEGFVLQESSTQPFYRLNPEMRERAEQLLAEPDC